MDNSNTKDKPSFFSNLVNRKFLGYSLRQFFLVGTYPMLKTAIFRLTKPIAGIQDIDDRKEPVSYLKDSLAESLAESYYDNLPCEMAIKMFTKEMRSYDKILVSPPLKSFTLEELFNLPQEELIAIPPYELAQRLPRGGIIALLARVDITYENQIILNKLSQVPLDHLTNLSEEELEAFHIQLFGALLNNPPQALENTLEKRMLNNLIDQKEMKQATVNHPEKSCLFFYFQQHEQNNASYFGRLAQRAGDEYHNIPFDLYQEENDIESKKRTLSIE